MQKSAVGYCNLAMPTTSFVSGPAVEPFLVLFILLGWLPTSTTQLIFSHQYLKLLNFLCALKLMIQLDSNSRRSCNLHMKFADWLFVFVSRKPVWYKFLLIAKKLWPFLQKLNIHFKKMWTDSLTLWKTYTLLLSWRIIDEGTFEDKWESSFQHVL